MVQYRDLTIKKQEDADTKENKHRTFRAMLCNAWGDVTGGSVWANKNARSVNFLPIGGRQIAQAKCYRLEPTLGLCVLMGYTDGSVVLEVISDDPLLRDTNTTGSSYLTPTPEDLQPGGRLQTWLYSKLFVPLSVYPSTTTLAIYIAGGYYTYQGTVKYYPATTGAGIALTAPTVVDTHYYAGLYIDGANTAQVIYSAANSTDSDPIEPTWPTSVVRLCVVYLACGQTLISLANDIFDRRIYYAENLSSAWPADGKVNISRVEYPTVTAAFAAAVASDFIKVGEGTFSEAGALTLPDETNMRGSGMGISIVTVSTATPALTATYSGAIVEKLTIQQLTAPAATVAISADGIIFREVEAYNSASNQTGFLITDCTLWECKYTGNGKAINAAGGTSHIYGGYFPSDVLIDVGSTLYLYYPVITGTITNNGTCSGWYYDGSGLLHSFGTGGTGQVLQQSTLNGAVSVSALTAGQVGAPALVNPSVVDNFVSFYDTTGAQKDSGYNAASFAALDYGKVSKLVASDGAPDPAFSVNAAGQMQYLLNGIVDGRLTLATGVPVTIASQTAKTTIYFTPYVGNRIALYTNSIWTLYNFTELSLSLAGWTAGKNNDIWIYDNAGTLTLDRTEWTNDTTRATALAYQDGVLTKNGDATRRYLGTIRTTAATGQCEDTSGRKCFVYNYYNRVLRALVVSEASNHTYNTATWRAWNNNQANADVQFVVGVVEDGLTAATRAALGKTATTGNLYVSIGLNTTTAPSVGPIANVVVGIQEMAGPILNSLPALGYNYLCVVEYSTVGASAGTFYNTDLSALVRM